MVSTGLTQTRHCEFKPSHGSIAGNGANKRARFYSRQESHPHKRKDITLSLAIQRGASDPAFNKGRGHSDFLASLATSAWGHQLSASRCIAVRGRIHQDVMLRAAWCRMSADRVRQRVRLLACFKVYELSAAAPTSPASTPMHCLVSRGTREAADKLVSVVASSSFRDLCRHGATRSRLLDTNR